MTTDYQRSGHGELGNDREFFESRETNNLNSADRGGINTIDGGEWFRSFGGLEIVLPPEHSLSTTLGTVWLSFDHVVHADGEVELIVQNRRLSDLPDGPKFPVQTGDVVLENR